LTEENVASCAPIAGKFARTPETSTATVVIFAKMSGIAGVTFVNCARTNARALRRLSCARIDRRSESIPATSAAIAAISGKTFVIDAETSATTGETVARCATINEHDPALGREGSGQ